MIFGLVSAILLYFSMTPTKKAEKASGWHEKEEIDFMEEIEYPGNV